MDNKEKNFASAIIYVHNAENRIEEFLKAIIDFMEDNFEHSEIICVNDCSDDRSVDIIKKCSDSVTGTSVSVINMSHFHGLELAMDAGMDLSIGDFVFEFDNTVLDFEQGMIMEVYRRSLQGFDIVSASPNRKAKLSSRLFYKVFDRFSDTTYQMTTESFRVLSRRVINRISSMNKTIPYRKAVYANCGLKTDNIKYFPKVFSAETSDKREKKYRSGLAADALILFTDLGYSFAKSMTALMMLMSVFMVLYAIVIFATGHPVEGWTTTILFLAVAFFGLFGILTIIIKYLQLIVNLVFKRKHYNFESIEKLTK
ncbi:dolichol-phosphate mannosyltransferase [Butyrivibrio fibrisolvens DSM 3071]|uniref:Dolichol-phosphate mannosyltransferase n=1 Tax=Butyrivibrio fibrisolvens DSM 3071 TaxID=1121131 RepID=A0A1M6A9K5_BUTFI|nr:glycosyltransferase [Butyrivibrio fibrisolvens]SHI33204.1 dolichol-phosphate mannosyltransferase [Butyrivibrio fibrisolvens DSM 3071]